ncbi:uncharacterized protein ANIA_11302 [Aspergillus nidulans FGSC A4]|uniref:Uncharacterized protein n=1 Tax=Emericella nidulans (strain FGSC A4 / ATCC 38163 / CBS 112.46 / NRRL 194 / M139) TaxID=227321 RepID=C8VM49_EMENI|nr:hypothetical protein [Aspergillus nidulans FGSC A4]CBF84851.1 TPA: hypothetical protein ANIA_11302 [Aspergillus nidulans FGSC A4]
MLLEEVAKAVDKRSIYDVLCGVPAGYVFKYEKKYTIFCALINYLVIVAVVLDLSQPVHLLEVGSNSAHGKE